LRVKKQGIRLPNKAKKIPKAILARVRIILEEAVTEEI